MVRSLLEVVYWQLESLSELHKTWLRFLSLLGLAEQAIETRVAATPHDVVFAERTLKLLHYRRQTPPVYAEPLLICSALVNRFYILDLQPDRSVVRHYLERGFDVYLIDWGVPTLADSGLRLEDYVGKLLKNVVSSIVTAHGRADLNLLGYSTGGTMAVLFTALSPQTIKNLTLLAAPIDFSSQELLLHLWMDAKHFDVDAFIDAYGNCPGAFLQACFLLQKPVQNLLGKYWRFYDSLYDPSFVENFFATERWVNDNIPVAGETFRQLVKKLYQGNELVKGEFSLGGQRIDLGRIQCPLLLLTAKNDHLVPPASTEGICTSAGSRDVESMTLEADHVGLAVSGKAHKTIWPEAAHWLAGRSTAVSPPEPRS
jgi:polyhydroxyalkanoate synthase